MKYLIFILFAATLQAQTTTKSFVLQPDGATYFEVVRITNDDGTYTEAASLVGPLTALATDQADKIETKMKGLAAAAFTVSFANRTIREVVSIDSLINSITTISALRLIQDRYQSELLTSGWTIDIGTGTFTNLVFTINGQGNLRYSVAGGATKSAIIYGSVIRLQGFPSTGVNTDFFLNENGSRYFSLPNRLAIIKKP